MRIVLLSDRVDPRSGQGQAKLDVLALDRMRAGPRHQHLALTLTLIGSGRADPRANGAMPCPWTVYESPPFLFLCIFFPLVCIFFPLVWQVTETLPYSICHYGMNLYDVRGTNCCSICMLWIRSPRQSRRFQMLRNTMVRSEMLQTLLNIF